MFDDNKNDLSALLGLRSNEGNENKKVNWR